MGSEMCIRDSAHAVQGHGLATDHGDISVTAFVAGVGFVLRGTGRVEFGLCSQRGLGCWKGRKAEVFEPNFATHIAAMAHEKTGFGRDEAQAVVGVHDADRRRPTQQLARFRVQSSG